MAMTIRQETQYGLTTLTDPYNEPVTGERWWGWITFIADGKLYVGHY